LTGSGISPNKGAMIITVCPLSRLEETVTRCRARHLLTLINAATLVSRPPGILPENHLFLGISDILEPLEGHVAPAEEHIDALLSFVRRWDRATPLVVHCFAGISRSTAAAFVTACALSPNRDEFEAAQTLRAASPTATPNSRIVALADRRLGRQGRMVAAIAAIGRGRESAEGAPFDYGL
jgi:predicted protein tyrosine phosphatase